MRNLPGAIGFDPLLLKDMVLAFQVEKRAGEENGPVRRFYLQAPNVTLFTGRVDGSDVEVAHEDGVVLDEFAARFNFVAH